MWSSRTHEYLVCGSNLNSKNFFLLFLKGLWFLTDSNEWYIAFYKNKHKTGNIGQPAEIYLTKNYSIYLTRLFLISPHSHYHYHHHQGIKIAWIPLTFSHYSSLSTIALNSLLLGSQCPYRTDKCKFLIISQHWDVRV